MNLPGIARLDPMEREVLSKLEKAAAASDIRKSGLTMPLSDLASEALESMAKRKAVRDNVTQSAAMDDLLQHDAEARQIYSVVKADVSVVIADEASLAELFVRRQKGEAA